MEQFPFGAAGTLLLVVIFKGSWLLSAKLIISWSQWEQAGWRLTCRVAVALGPVIGSS